MSFEDLTDEQREVLEAAHRDSASWTIWPNSVTGPDGRFIAFCDDALYADPGLGPGVEWIQPGIYPTGLYWSSDTGDNIEDDD